jgi:hypothetical protein
MSPEGDARAILRLALRHELSLAASLNPAFAQQNWGFLAQQCVENLLQRLGSPAAPGRGEVAGGAPRASGFRRQGPLLADGHAPTGS